MGIKPPGQIIAPNLRYSGPAGVALWDWWRQDRAFPGKLPLEHGSLQRTHSRESADRQGNQRSPSGNRSPTPTSCWSADRQGNQCRRRERGRRGMLGGAVERASRPQRRLSSGVGRQPVTIAKTPRGQSRFRADAGWTAGVAGRRPVPQHAGQTSRQRAGLSSRRKPPASALLFLRWRSCGGDGRRRVGLVVELDNFVGNVHRGRGPEYRALRVAHVKHQGVAVAHGVLSDHPQ